MVAVEASDQMAVEIMKDADGMMIRKDTLNQHVKAGDTITVAASVGAVAAEITAARETDKVKEVGLVTNKDIRKQHAEAGKIVAAVHRAVDTTTTMITIAVMDVDKAKEAGSATNKGTPKLRVADGKTVAAAHLVAGTMMMTMTATVEATATAVVEITTMMMNTLVKEEDGTEILKAIGKQLKGAGVTVAINLTSPLERATQGCMAFSFLRTAKFHAKKKSLHKL
jgi:hypothetical protein